MLIKRCTLYEHSLVRDGYPGSGFNDCSQCDDKSEEKSIGNIGFNRFVPDLHAHKKDAFFRNGLEVNAMELRSAFMAFGASMVAEERRFDQRLIDTCLRLSTSPTPVFNPRLSSVDPPISRRTRGRAWIT